MEEELLESDQLSAQSIGRGLPQWSQPRGEGIHKGQVIYLAVTPGSTGQGERQGRVCPVQVCSWRGDLWEHLGLHLTLPLGGGGFEHTSGPAHLRAMKPDISPAPHRVTLPRGYFLSQSACASSCGWRKPLAELQMATGRSQSQVGLRGAHGASTASAPMGTSPVLTQRAW